MRKSRFTEEQIIGARRRGRRRRIVGHSRRQGRQGPTAGPFGNARRLGPRDLAYRLNGICERKKCADEALAYNGLVVAWPELTRLAAHVATGPAQADLGV